MNAVTPTRSSAHSISGAVKCIGMSLALAIGAAGCGEPAPLIDGASTPGSSASGDSFPTVFGFGRAASVAAIAAIDIDVMPDGTGLPAGSGTPSEGARLYAERCAACHGPTGNEGPNDRLVGRFPGDSFSFGDDPSTASLRTIGAYWPYATTLFDYTRRAMPQTAPGSLTDDETYALTAFLLYRNGLIERTEEMNAKSLPRVQMPARDRFIRDDRPRYQEVR